MLKSIRWVEDRIFSLKLSENIYCLAQMRKNHLMEFFNIFQKDENWENIDLNSEEILFCIFVAENRLKPIFSSILVPKKITPNQRPIKKAMLAAIFGKGPQGGAKLIELNENYDTYPENIIKDNLSIKTDPKIIYENELDGMVGDPEKIRKRLLVYVETGVNWDESKGFLFSGIPLPPPSKVKFIE